MAVLLGCGNTFGFIGLWRLYRSLSVCLLVGDRDLGRTMNEDFKASLVEVDELSGEALATYCNRVIKMLACLSDAVDECCSNACAGRVVSRFMALMGEN